MVSSTIRFPLGFVRGLTVGPKGRIIYFSDQNRLQIFSNEGRFLRGWFVYTSKQCAPVYVDANDHIHVIPDDHKHVVFDFEGNLLKESREPGVQERFFKLHEKRVLQDSQGNVYRLRWNVTRIGVLKVGRAGEQFIDITEPFYLWPFRGLMAVFVFLIPSILISVVAERWKARKKKKQALGSPDPAPQN
jgi:hypothetical protein